MPMQTSRLFKRSKRPIRWAPKSCWSSRVTLDDENIIERNIPLGHICFLLWCPQISCPLQFVDEQKPLHFRLWAVSSSNISSQIDAIVCLFSPHVRNTTPFFSLLFALLRPYICATSSVFRFWFCFPHGHCSCSSPAKYLLPWIGVLFRCSRSVFG